jgi:hypothetical protein
MSDAELVFGSLPLLSSGFADADYTIEALGDGADFGTPEAVIASVASMLMDGNKARINGFGNREVTIPIQIRGANLDIVAAGEAAVMAEVNRGRNTLTWTPPGMTTPSVYDVVYSVLAPNFLDLDEVRVTRKFTLTLECISFPRRAELTTVVATPIPAPDPTVTSINDCTSLTGWTAEGGTMAVVGADAIRITKSTVDDFLRLSLGGLSLATLDTDCIAVEVVTSGWTIPPIALRINGQNRTIIAVQYVSGSREKWYFDAPTTTVTTLDIVATTDTIAAATMTIYDVSMVDQPPFLGSRRQRMFTATVGGSARTQADLAVEVDDGSSTIGSDLLLFSAPMGAAIAPPMRQWWESGDTPISDAATISGAVQTFSTPSVYRIPAAAVPAGAHLIVARLMTDFATGAVFEWTASIHGSDYTAADTDTSGTANLLLTLDWKFHSIGVVMLPPVALDSASNAEVEITLDTTDTLATLDELYLFNLDTGVLTWLTDLDQGAETPTRAVVRSASLDSPQPQWLVGTAGTSADDVDASSRATSPGIHEFVPGVMNIFAVTPDATEQTVTVGYYERAMHNITPPAA